MIFVVTFVLFIVVIAVIKSKNISSNKTNSTQKKSQKIAVGMYFMDLSENLRKDRNPILNKSLLQEYYWILGCAAQGRIQEVKENINFVEDSKLESFFKIYKPQILKMAKIAKEVNEKPTGYDLINGESVGEYFDRKVSKRPAFMKEFEFFKDFDIQSYLKSI